MPVPVFGQLTPYSSVDPVSLSCDVPGSVLHACGFVGAVLGQHPRKMVMAETGH